MSSKLYKKFGQNIVSDYTIQKHQQSISYYIT